MWIKVQKPNGWSPCTPLWGNLRLPHFQSIPDPVLWARFEIKTLADIVSPDGLLTFDDLKRQQGLPNVVFRYLQLRHAFWSLFPPSTVVEITGVELLLSAVDETKPLSTLYSVLAGLDTSKVSQLCSVWQADIPTLADDDWEEGIQQYLSLVISTRDRFTQIKFLHGAYFSPKCQARIYPDRSSICLKCASEEGTFFHVVWSCQHIQTFWRGVINVNNSVGKLRVYCDPIPLLLGIVDTLEAPKSKKLFFFYGALLSDDTAVAKPDKCGPAFVQTDLSGTQLPKKI